MAVTFKNRDIISITDFSREEIHYLCEAGKRMYELEKNGSRNNNEISGKRNANPHSMVNKHPHSLAGQICSSPSGCISGAGTCDLVPRSQALNATPNFEDDSSGAVTQWRVCIEFL